MKPLIKSSLGLIAMLLIAASAYGIPGPKFPHYPATLTGVLSTQLVSGTVTVIKSVPVNNATIIKAVAIANPGVKAADLILVIQPGTLQVDVINKTTDDVLEVIGSDGSSYGSTAEILSQAKSGIYFYLEEEADYLFNLPGVTLAQTVNLTVTHRYNPVSGVDYDYVISFVGGSGTEATGANFFRGSIRQTSNTDYMFSN